MIIFTDDPEWYIQTKRYSNQIGLWFRKGTGSYHDLYLMTQCSDFIISTQLILGGRWRLANHEEWTYSLRRFGHLNNQHKSLKDLYPSHWEILDYD